MCNLDLTPAIVTLMMRNVCKHHKNHQAIELLSDEKWPLKSMKWLILGAIVGHR